MLFYFGMLRSFCFFFLSVTPKSQHAELQIKGLPGGRSCTSTLVLLYSSDRCTFPVPPSSTLSLLFVPLPLRPLSLPATSSTPPTPPPQHTCRPRSGTCLCLWGPVLSSFFTCGLCKSASSSSSHTSTTSSLSTRNTTCTTSKLYHTTSRAQEYTPRRESRPVPPDTGHRPCSCWSRTWREESKR